MVLVSLVLVPWCLKAPISTCLPLEGAGVGAIAGVLVVLLLAINTLLDKYTILNKINCRLFFLCKFTGSAKSDYLDFQLRQRIPHRRRLRRLRGTLLAKSTPPRTLPSGRFKAVVSRRVFARWGGV